MVPLTNTLTRFNDIENHMALPFVVEAFNSLKAEISRAVTVGKIKKDRIFGNLKVVQAYISPDESYNKNIGRTLNAFNNAKNPNLKDTNIITSYQDYVKEFFNIVEKKRALQHNYFKCFCEISQIQHFELGVGH